jgi:hypothetical protein
MGHVQIKLSHIEAQEYVSVTIQNIRLVLIIEGDVRLVSLLNDVHEELSDFGQGDEDNNHDVGADALLATVRDR